MSRTFKDVSTKYRTTDYELNKQKKTNVVNKRNAIKFELDQLELSTQRLTKLLVGNDYEN